MRPPCERPTSSPIGVICSVNDPRANGRPKARFPTTHWSRVVTAGDRSAPGAREALADLCSAYWYPLYAFVRRRGHDPEAAEDLVQGFFASLLERESLAGVDRTKGRFRSFLVAACALPVEPSRPRTGARSAAGGRAIVPIDVVTAEDRYRREPAHELTPERLFERRWATTLLDHVLGRLEAEMDGAGKASTFAAEAGTAGVRRTAGVCRDRPRAGLLRGGRAGGRASPPRAVPHVPPRGGGAHPRRPGCGR